MRNFFFSVQPSNWGINLAALLLRLAFGGLMIPHGWQKLSGLLAGKTQFADPVGLGEYPSLVLTVFAEFFCAWLVVVGLFHRLALIPLMITMLVAAFVVHANDAFDAKEHALLFLGAYVPMWLLGPGRYSVDALLARQKLK
jgi:putative oxidoreductase